jgi:hypothetical protein
LPDHLLRRLLRTLHPSPDLFAVALTCRRLRRALSGPGSYLVVVAAASPTPSRPPSAAAFADLASAVAASRPGDTIWLSPTPPPAPAHRVDAAVRVRHPLNIVGGGASPRDTRVECRSDAAPAVLDFSAPRARVANVSLAHRGKGGAGGAAVLHRSGRLRVERCRLEGARHALPGLSAPLVTVAVVAAGEEEEEELLDGRARSSSAPPTATAAAAAAAAGAPCSPSSRSVLEVSETELCAAGRRGQGVRALGTGEVAAVRAVFGGGAGASTRYWLEVDAARPGTRAPGGAAAAASLLSLGRVPAAVAPLLPPVAAAARPPAPPPPHPLAPKAWRGVGPDDPLLRINALLGKRGRDGGGGICGGAVAEPPPPGVVVGSSSAAGQLQEQQQQQHQPQRQRRR